MQHSFNKYTKIHKTSKENQILEEKYNVLLLSEQTGSLVPLDPIKSYVRHVYWPLLFATPFINT